jgi:hypothetical protein
MGLAKLSKLKNSITISGLETATFRLAHLYVGITAPRPLRNFHVTLNSVCIIGRKLPCLIYGVSTSEKKRVLVCK